MDGGLIAFDDLDIFQDTYAFIGFKLYSLSD